MFKKRRLPGLTPFWIFRYFFFFPIPPLLSTYMGLCLTNWANRSDAKLRTTEGLFPQIIIYNITGRYISGRGVAQLA